MMAALCQAVFLLVVCGLVQQTDCACNVTCTTDYFSRLNCSTSGTEGPESCDVEAECRDEFESVNGSCVIRPPQRWCTIEPERFYQMVNIDTVCTLKVKWSNQQQEPICTSKDMNLQAIVKPRQPFNLTLTKSNGDFNLSWEMAYISDGGLDGLLMYRVRLEPADGLNEKHRKEFYVRDDCRYQEIRCELLLPNKAYVASVQATVNSRSFPSSQWSEWSTSSEWSCPHTDSSALTGPNRYHLLFLLSGLLLFVLLFFFGKQGWHKKLGLFQYIPNPQDFFKPLYHTYQGDFKKWVGPVLTFNSFDILEKSVPLQVLTEKQLASVPLQRELLQEPGSGGTGLGDWSLLSLVNAGSSKRYFLGGSSLGTTHSGGHISMDTVTVSGQEGTMSDWTGGSSRNRPDPGFHRAGQRAPGVSDEDDFPGLDGREGLEERGVDNWQLQGNEMDNIEEISLDSYSSNEQSDDGYPQMGLDLDTIDSGFLESDCSSPMNSECDGGEQMDAALLAGGVGAHSNYVKQWVAVTPLSEDQSNSE
ncbi:interleukin 21 receptor, tandem duplicate 1 isoform X1 [Pygocentrus nattereri]|uniref:interleukin 21 receptor, tandem duplicate 1 isoform X1 n=1 Tax=Pygocentrus nattereri TaxID=42514 RepID=UPI00081499D3|nr:interleukin 21 receptor, tandem duplicate 1 isoform X1 [Pygocentrus nattereri]XP_017563035.1 interleukin 21 receptor, tandem duplicate 1 isoform X1 [Pygocentrus nattereri]XP_017563036.1 interleukin 21 receptor, tandem duplicate 1 isoform X1 [Pygocentrus nattereri]XP_017563037.1 interleukin 21 receptor, tandem duplicate 1 isoform X1 [Pygocentrus nattereri]